MCAILLNKYILILLYFYSVFGIDCTFRFSVKKSTEPVFGTRLPENQDERKSEQEYSHPALVSYLTHAKSKLLFTVGKFSSNAYPMTRLKTKLRFTVGQFSDDAYLYYSIPTSTKISKLRSSIPTKRRNLYEFLNAQSTPDLLQANQQSHLTTSQSHNKDADIADITKKVIDELPKPANQFETVINFTETDNVTNQCTPKKTSLIHHNKKYYETVIFTETPGNIKQNHYQPVQFSSSAEYFGLDQHQTTFIESYNYFYEPLKARTPAALKKYRSIYALPKPVIIHHDLLTTLLAIYADHYDHIARYESTKKISAFVNYYNEANTVPAPTFISEYKAVNTFPTPMVIDGFEPLKRYSVLKHANRYKPSRPFTIPTNTTAYERIDTETNFSETANLLSDNIYYNLTRFLTYKPTRTMLPIYRNKQSTLLLDLYRFESLYTSPSTVREYGYGYPELKYSSINPYKTWPPELQKAQNVRPTRTYQRPFFWASVPIQLKHTSSEKFYQNFPSRTVVLFGTYQYKPPLTTVTNYMDIESATTTYWKYVIVSQTSELPENDQFLDMLAKSGMTLKTFDPYMSMMLSRGRETEQTTHKNERFTIISLPSHYRFTIQVIPSLTLAKLATTKSTENIWSPIIKTLQTKLWQTSPIDTKYILKHTEHDNQFRTKEFKWRIPIETKHSPKATVYDSKGNWRRPTRTKYVPKATEGKTDMKIIFRTKGDKWHKPIKALHLHEAAENDERDIEAIFRAKEDTKDWKSAMETSPPDATDSNIESAIRNKSRYKEAFWSDLFETRLPKTTNNNLETDKGRFWSSSSETKPKAFHINLEGPVRSKPRFEERFWSSSLETEHVSTTTENNLKTDILRQSEIKGRIWSSSPKTIRVSETILEASTTKAKLSYGYGEFWHLRPVTTTDHQTTTTALLSSSRTPDLIRTWRPTTTTTATVRETRTKPPFPTSPKPTRTQDEFQWNFNHHDEPWPSIKLVTKTKPTEMHNFFYNYVTLYSRNQTTDARTTANTTMGTSDLTSSLQLNRSNVLRKNNASLLGQNAKCFVCGLNISEIPMYPTCYHIFNDHLFGNVKKRYRVEKCPDEVDSSIKVKGGKARLFRGGCFNRYLDVGELYDERGCRYWPPIKGQSFASKKLMYLEITLWNVNDGCVAAPAATLTPFSRAISLWARYHVCVCSGKYCNMAPEMNCNVVLIVFCMFVSYKISFRRDALSR